MGAWYRRPWSDGSGQTAVVETVASGGADSRHRIEVEFRKGTGGARIGLMWSGPGASGLVPGTHLRPHYGLVTRTTAADATPGSPPTVTEPLPTSTPTPAWSPV